MGCDIHAYGETLNEDGSWVKADIDPEPFDWRSYRVFAFLAGVRNYSAVTPISEPRGLPEDVSDDIRINFEDWGYDGHSASWLSLEELTRFNYSAQTEDRRISRNGDGGCTCAPGEGTIQTWREYLGDGFFDELDRLKNAGVIRIVFWFDN